MQARRLALGCCLHARLGAQALWITDTDVIRLIGQKVVGQILVSRTDATQQLIAAQRARMLRGEAILRGTVVRFEGHGDGVYVGDAHTQKANQKKKTHHGRRLIITAEEYPFSFGEGADANVKLMYPALMEPSQWSVQPAARAGELEPGSTAEDGVPPADQTPTKKDGPAPQPEPEPGPKPQQK